MSCIFCKIIAGDIPAKTVYEDNEFKAILDTAPASRGHVLILPKEHADDLMALSDDTLAKVLPLAKKIAAATSSSLEPAGIKLVQNNGETAGQSVRHFHMHVIPCYDGHEVGNWQPTAPSDEELDAVRDAIAKAL